MRLDISRLNIQQIFELAKYASTASVRDDHRSNATRQAINLREKGVSRSASVA